MTLPPAGIFLHPGALSRRMEAPVHDRLAGEQPNPALPQLAAPLFASSWPRTSLPFPPPSIFPHALRHL